MKKTLVAFLLLALLLSIAGTALAAVNPFTDVPANHWAYDAVRQLAKDGIIDGYNKGTFDGDKTLTRYEIAQIVAKAMAKVDKADAKNKILIDKLALEFTAELNNLGVRITKLEDKTNIGLAGETRIRLMGDNPSAKYSASKLQGANKIDFRERIKFNAAINDKVSFFARLATNNIAFTGANSSSGTASTSFDMLNVTVKNMMGIDNITVGRIGIVALGNGMIAKTANADGGYFADKIGDLTLKGYAANIDTSTTTTITSAANTLSSVNLGTKLGAVNLSGGYYHSDIACSSSMLNAAGVSNAAFTSSRGWDAAFDTKVGNLTLMGEYVGTTLKNATAIADKPKGWAIQLDSGNHAPAFYPTVSLVNPARVGEDALMVQYRSADPGALPYSATSWEGTAATTVTTKLGDNLNVLFLAYQNVVAKNVIVSLEYQNLKAKDKNVFGASTANIDKTYMMKFEFFY